MATRTDPDAAVAADPVRHLTGCPAERLETYDVQRPDGRTVVITRCQDCGAQAQGENRG